MTESTPSYDDLLHENIDLRLKLAEFETRIERGHQAEEQLRISQRVAAEAALSLRTSHAFIRQIIDTDPNFVFAKDRQGRFTLVNQAVADWYGTPVEKLIGKTDAD